MQKEEKLKQTVDDGQSDLFIQDLVAEVENDFKKRRNERVAVERQWQLNMNFLAGNQYCKINSRGELDDEDSEYYWQNRQVFNHIAPLIETRLAKFSKIQPSLHVRPKTDNDKDIEGASVAERLISQTFSDCNMKEIIKKVTVWSETCGSGFYKVLWNNDGGESMGTLDGKEIYEGSAEILPVSPFEIFPDSLYTQEIDDCESIIHARAVRVSAVKEKYGVTLAGKDIDVFSMTSTAGTSFADGNAVTTVKDSVIVIEKFQKPCSEFPNGRLITVAEGKLLYYGELPYVNGKNKTRTFPFVKQDAITNAGSFFGSSLIERLIPLQRSFNAVKNRKHEFLNRLSMGVLTVEDGSLDVDDLNQDGLSPGKILVYRQGSKAPEIMSETTLPVDFTEEENKLLNEFVIVSGVSDVSSSSDNASLSSGSALQILIEQDNERLLLPAENIRNCYVNVAKQVVRLFAQFLSGMRAVKYYDAFNKARISYASRESVRSDDVYDNGDNAFMYSQTQKKELIYKLYNSGLLFDEKGTVKSGIKSKVLEMMGYEDLDDKKGLSRLHEEKAQMENEKMRSGDIDVEEIDDDEIHISEHVKYALSEYAEFSDQLKERYFKHVRAHKDRLNQKQTKTGE